MAFFFRKKAPLSVLKVFLQSGNQLLLKIDYGKSKRRAILLDTKSWVYMLLACVQ